MKDRYSLRGGVRDGVTSVTAEEFEGEVEATWFSASVERKPLKELMRRSDAAGWRHFGPWLVLLIGSLVGVIVTWLSWATVPFLVVYGVSYAMSDHHAHELSHGTPFRTRRVNEVLYHLNAFMALHEAYYWRWSHTRHHTHTMLVGRDPEIAIQRPPSLMRIALDFFYIPSGLTQLRIEARIAFTGRMTADAENFVPAAERHKVVRNSRVYMAIVLATIVASVVFRSWLPLVLVVTPRFWGGPLAQWFNITQHAGLAEDVYDHRLNTRTVIMNPLARFLYMNMNFHIEHHMFPMVPFHSLDRLHAIVEAQCAPASTSTFAAWRELLPAVRRQKVDPTYSLARELV